MNPQGAANQTGDVQYADFDAACHLCGQVLQGGSKKGRLDGKDVSGKWRVKCAQGFGCAVDKSLSDDSSVEEKLSSLLALSRVSPWTSWLASALERRLLRAIGRPQGGLDLVMGDSLSSCFAIGPLEPGVIVLAGESHDILPLADMGWTGWSAGVSRNGLAHLTLRSAHGLPFAVEANLDALPSFPVRLAIQTTRRNVSIISQWRADILDIRTLVSERLSRGLRSGSLRLEGGPPLSRIQKN